MENGVLKAFDRYMSEFIEDRSLREKVHVFKDRKEAGLRLAKTLSGYRGRDGIVLGIPSGGIPNLMIWHLRCHFFRYMM